ncbi:MAG: hypothetical protein Q7S87_01680 [Agitococcus sp.]|nr:hypothetical protein [Agitococcus sp.]
MSHQGTLSEEDFKVEGHCCAVTFPAIKTLEDGIDFQVDEAVKAYMAEHYEMTLTTTKAKKVDVANVLQPDLGD